MKLNYVCKYCGATNTIKSFWRWLFTPHLGNKKYLKCTTCKSKRHAMKRKDKPFSIIDLP